MPTPKQAVLAVYPRAYCAHSATFDLFFVRAEPIRRPLHISQTAAPLGEGKRPNAAWSDAARRIAQEKK